MSSGAHCETCSDPVKLNPKTVGMVSPVDGQILNGWYHADSMKRDHQATPHDGRSWSDEEARVTAGMDQARMAVRDHMKKRFDEIHIRNSIDDIFNDRRD